MPRASCFLGTWPSPQNDFDVDRTALELLGVSLGEILFSGTRGALASILRAEVDESGRLELVRELTGFEALPLLRALLRGLEGP